MACAANCARSRSSVILAKCALASSDFNWAFSASFTNSTSTSPASNGQAIQYYRYSENGGSPTQLAANGVVSGLTNGQQYSFVIDACNTYCGSTGNTATATPDAPPTAPGISASTSGTTVTFSWGGAASNGCPISSVQYSLNGGGWTVTSAPGSAQTGGSYNTSYSIAVKVTDSCGLSSSSSGSATTGSPPPPPPPPTTVTVSRGGSYTGSGCSGCYWVAVSAQGFPAGTSVSFSCYITGSSSPFWTNPGSGGFGAWYSTNGSGDVSWNPPTGSAGKGCYTARGYSVTVSLTVGGVTGSGTDSSL